MTFFKRISFLKKPYFQHISSAHKPTTSSCQSQFVKPSDDIDMPNRQKEWRIPSQIARRNDESPPTCISPCMLTICMNGDIFHVQNSPSLKFFYKTIPFWKIVCKKTPMGQFAYSQSVFRHHIFFLHTS